MSRSIEDEKPSFFASIVAEKPLSFDENRVSVDLNRINDLMSQHSKFPEQMRMAFLRRFAQIAAPIIQTEVRKADETLIMAFPHKTPDTAPSQYMSDMVRWTALRESIKSSGLNVVDLPTTENDPMHLLWMRDSCIIVDDCAFFPDTGKHRVLQGDFLGKVWAVESAKQKIESLGLRSVRVKDSYFAGGNILFDDKTGSMFYGEDNNVNIKGGMERLARAIADNTGKTYNPVFVPNDHFSSYHIDLGCSEELPDGRYLVAEDLGPNRDGSGRKVLESVLGKDRVILVDPKHSGMIVPNLAVAGNGVFMTACPDVVRDELEKSGIRVNAPQVEDLYGTCFSLTDEFSAVRQIGTGGVHCFTNRVQTRYLSPAFR